MSTYQGWIREEMMGGRNVNKQPSESSMGSTEHLTAPFTPINRNSPPVQFVSPTKTLRALDADSLYDLLEDEPSLAPVSNRKKRPSAQSNKGLTISVVRDLHSTTEGQIHFGQGGSADGYTTKRRKSASAKRSKSANTSSSSITQLWETMPQQNQVPQDEQAGSQWATPSDSWMRKKSRAKSSSNNTKTRKTGPFIVPTITKPSVVIEKEPAQIVSSSQLVSTHQGWTTTEDTVKSNPKAITIAKTTLDKLAAFRYKSMGQNLAEPQSSTQTREIEPDHGLQQSQADEPGLIQVSSDYDLILSEDNFSRTSHTQEVSAIQTESPSHFQHLEDHTDLSPNYGPTLDEGDFFADAAWNNGNQSDPNTAESPVKHHQISSPIPEQVSNTVHISQQYTEGYQTMSNQNDRPVEVISQENFAWRDARAQHNDNNDEFYEPKHITDLEEPNSSDSRAPNQILDKLIVPQQEWPLHEKDPGYSPSEVHDGLGVFDVEADDEMQVENDCEPEGIGTPATRDGSGSRTYHQLSPTLQNPSIQDPESYVLRPQTYVQAEGSDMDEYEPVPSNDSRDFEIDEFDEGLEDSDLLGILSDSLIPEAQVHTLVNETNDSVAQSSPRTHPSPSSAINASKKNRPHEVAPPTIQIDSRSVSLRVLGHDLDDEFPMDEGEEEEMLKLPELITSITEAFEAPSGLEYPFADQSSEVYDSTLQFSPPKSIVSAALPSKMTDCNKYLHTDNYSAPPSPTRRSESSSRSSNDEDEWSFIRSTEFAEIAERQTTPDPIVGPLKRTTASGIGKGPQLSSPARASRHNPSEMGQSVVRSTSSSNVIHLDDSHEYERLNAFARPDFPVLIRDRCPVIGLSAQTFLRTCFRIGEMYKEGKRCNSLSQDAVIELFARVTFSSRDSGTTKQHFHFADLFNDRPPFPHGTLMNYKTTGLADAESKVFLDAEEGKLARCLGRLKRDAKNVTGWLLHIISIRETNWEEIRYTKRIVSADILKSEPIVF